MMMRARVGHMAALFLAAGCGGGGDSPTSPGGSTTVASVSINSGATSVAVGASIALGAAALNSSGTAVGATFAWSSSNTAIATVGASTGLVTGVAVGSATVTATAGGVSGTRIISVTAATPPPLSAQITMPGTSFQPSQVTIGRGGTITWVFTTITHNVIFGSGSGAQNIPNTSNTSVPVTFNTAGVFSMTCTIHAGMSGTITVQ